jgi:hypothetical protein
MRGSSLVVVVLVVLVVSSSGCQGDFVTVRCSILESSGTVDLRGRQMKQC